MNVSTVDGTAMAGCELRGHHQPTDLVRPGPDGGKLPDPPLEDGSTNTLPFYFRVVLSDPSTGVVLGAPTNAQVNIVDA